MSDKQLPLNDVLNSLDRRDYDWYSRLTDDDKKKWSSWLFIRYASSVKGKDAGEALLNTNEFVNKHYTDLYKHDELIWKLMCLTGTGKKQFHEWIKPPTSAKKKDTVSEFVADTFPHLKPDEVELFIKLNDASDIEQLAQDVGKTKDEIGEIFGKKKRKKK